MGDGHTAIVRPAAGPIDGVHPTIGGGVNPTPDSAVGTDRSPAWSALFFADQPQTASAAPVWLLGDHS